MGVLHLVNLGPKLLQAPETTISHRYISFNRNHKFYNTFEYPGIDKNSTDSVPVKQLQQVPLCSR